DFPRDVILMPHAEGAATLVLTVHDWGATRVWEIPTGKMLHEFPYRRLAGRVSENGDSGLRKTLKPVFATACITCASGSLACTSFADGTLRVWDVPKRQLEHDFVGRPKSQPIPQDLAL